MLENILVKEMYYDSDMWIKFFFLTFKISTML